jgi:hypothetical protein
MPIQANNCDPNQRLGAHSAQFRVNSSGISDGEFSFPLAGPKTIRRIVVITGANSLPANVNLKLTVNQSPGGDVIAAQKAGNLASNSVLKWEESELDRRYTTMSSAQEGITFEVTGSGAAYDFRIEVIYDSGLQAGLKVCQNQDIEGL